jgi:hypothetical protein
VPAKDLLAEFWEPEKEAEMMLQDVGAVIPGLKPRLPNNINSAKFNTK